MYAILLILAYCSVMFFVIIRIYKSIKKPNNVVENASLILMTIPIALTLSIFISAMGYALLIVSITFFILYLCWVIVNRKKR